MCFWPWHKSTYPARNCFFSYDPPPLQCRALFIYFFISPVLQLREYGPLFNQENMLHLALILLLIHICSAPIQAATGRSSAPLWGATHGQSLPCGTLLSKITPSFRLLATGFFLLLAEDFHFHDDQILKSLDWLKSQSRKICVVEISSSRKLSDWPSQSQENWPADHSAKTNLIGCTLNVKTLIRRKSGHKNIWLTEF